MWYRAAADLVMVVHLLFISFVVGGAFLAWRWPRIIWAHIPAAVYHALVEFAGFTCPLTLLENYLRRRAGQAGYRGGFIAHYLVPVMLAMPGEHGGQGQGRTAGLPLFSLWYPCGDARSGRKIGCGCCPLTPVTP
jgi:hypothetical protein